MFLKRRSAEQNIYRQKIVTAKHNKLIDYSKKKISWNQMPYDVI